MQSGEIALKCIRRLFTALEQLNAVIDGGSDSRPRLGIARREELEQSGAIFFIMIIII